jgi:hypothetical protein
MLQHFRLLFSDFSDFARRDFNLKAYLCALAVVACSVVVAYATDWGNSFARGLAPTNSAWLNYLLRYGVIYYAVAVPTLIFKRDFATLTNPKFYLKSFVFILILSFANHISWRKIIELPNFSSKEISYTLKLLGRSRNLIFMLPVLVAIRVFFDKKIKGLYGLCSGNHHVRAYLSLYVVVVPLLIFASLTPDFLSYYPNYKPWIYSDVFARPIWLNTLMFELIYMADFIMVEVFFRGALVIGMAALLGRSAVLPMVAVYVALHFGKPALEAISAIFGGYFLGTLAFQTRHIWGGVIIHMGIALMIELLRFFEHYVLKIG